VCPPVSSRPQHLPDFGRPPLIEVALSVQFEPLSNFQPPHMGLLWSRFRDRFPQMEVHPPLPSIKEDFMRRKARKLTIEVELSGADADFRYWFLNEKSTELIQVQRDRFAHNWRKVDTEGEYPRFETIRDRFREELKEFECFISDEQLGTLQPDQCEITYVNHIAPNQTWASHADIGDVFSFWRADHDEFLRGPEAEHLAMQYLLPNPDPVGRLHVTIDSAFSAEDESPVFVMNLVARGAPLEGDEGVIRFLELGRDWIVRGFTSLTSETMHRIWERTK
jgi:uncharacterized protein (TIGR04255 family)